MNIAYLISAHNDPQQLKRLVEALGDNAWCFIHIDRKSDIQPFIQALECIEGDRIQFIKERTDVRWGTILEVEYQMALLKAALSYSKAMRKKEEWIRPLHHTQRTGFPHQTLTPGIRRHL